MKFKYTITKFDKENKLVVVTFDDGQWAELRLVNPLPKTIEELETVIKQFTAPKEAIEAQLNPDTDLSYIDNLIGVEKECDRFVMNPEPAPAPTIDPELEANLKMWEQQKFEKEIAQVLLKFGILESDPTAIPVTNI